MSIRERKLPAYTSLVEGLFKAINHSINSEVDGCGVELDMASLFQQVTPDLITWAGDEVLIAWSQYRRTAGKLEGAAALFGFEEVFLAIRRDFGHSNKNIVKGDLLGLFVNDVDDYL